MRGTRARVDAGETLLESLISLMFVGTAVTAVIVGVGVGARLSGDHRSTAVAEVAVKAVVEQLKATTYIPGACPAPCARAYPVTGAPPGFQVRVLSIVCLPQDTATTYEISALSPCSTVTDQGLQVLRVSVAAADGRAQEVVQFMKRQGAP